MRLVQQVAQAQRREALLPLGDPDELRAAVVAREQRLERELKVRVVPLQDLKRDDRQVLRVDAEMVPHENAERRLLRRLGFQRGAHEVAEEGDEFVAIGRHGCSLGGWGYDAPMEGPG